MPRREFQLPGLKEIGLTSWNVAIFSTANACYKDAADLFAELDRFREAIALYDKVADYSLGSALTKYSVKEYWLRSSLCALAAQVSCAALPL